MVSDQWAVSSSKAQHKIIPSKIDGTTLYLYLLDSSLRRRRQRSAAVSAVCAKAPRVRACPTAEQSMWGVYYIFLITGLSKGGAGGEGGNYG